VRIYGEGVYLMVVDALGDSERCLSLVTRELIFMAEVSIFGARELIFRAKI
jgi:hypothetical protein